MVNKLFSPALLCSLALGSSIWYVQENTAPKLALTLVSENSGLRPNAKIPYTINVVDLEDGASEYGEIPVSEVILSVKYLRDSAAVDTYLAQHESKNTDVLSWMGRENCFSCHAAKTKLIGPPFEQIAMRYTQNETTTRQLAKKIIEGSTGVWGDQVMPTRHDLEMDQVNEVVTWILSANRDAEFNYFSGTAGTFLTQEKKHGAAVYVLSAHYRDHGLQGDDQNAKKSIRTVVLKAE